MLLLRPAAIKTSGHLMPPPMPASSAPLHCGREDGVMGSLEARGVAQGDWTSFWQAVIVDLFRGGTARGHSSCAAAPLKAGIDAVRARGDFQRRCGTSIGTIDRRVAWPLTLDGEPGNEPQWRLCARAGFHRIPVTRLYLAVISLRPAQIVQRLRHSVGLA
jgi:hypothetical protein